MKLRIKHFFLCLFFAFTCNAFFAQSKKIDSLRHVLTREKEDTNKVNTLKLFATYMQNVNPDTTILLALQAVELSARLNWLKGEANSYNVAGIGSDIKGDYTKAVEYYEKALNIAQKIEDKALQARTIGNIGIIYDEEGDYQKALDYYFKSLNLNVELKNKIGQANSLGNIAGVYDEQGDFPRALDFYMKSSNIYEETEDKQGLARNLGNIAIVYQEQSDYPKALDYDIKSLKIKEELGQKIEQANTLSNIGIVYCNLDEYPKAVDYFQKGLKIYDELGSKEGMAGMLNDIGNVYYEQHNYTQALDYDLKALDMYKEIGSKRGIPIILCDIGLLYQSEGKNTAKAEEYYNAALKIEEEIGDKKGMGSTLGDMGGLYTKTGQFKKAEECLEKSIGLDSSIGELNHLREYEEMLSSLYDTTGRFQLALKWYKKAATLKDSLFNIEKNKSLTRKELTYQFEKKQAADKAEQDKKDLQVVADKRKQQVIIWSVVGGLLLVLVFAGFVFRSLRITRKQKQVIEVKSKETEEQKKVIEEKNKDILDSIHYAQRIQKTLLASDALLQQNLPEHFVLFKPKDIVSGDFYWGTKHNDCFYLAVCDSTGHGVPGAFMSLLNISFLNEAITERGILQPNEIFSHTRKRLIENISQDGQQDGMDGILVAITAPLSPSEAGVGATLSYSAAYNPPIVVREGQIKELGIDKMPVGKSPTEHIPFTHYSEQIGKGDTLYLFTDGYADQFGGPKGKKFKYKQLQEKLLAISHQPLAEQKNILEQTFEEWKGSLEQVDDVLVIGIRV